MWQSYQFVKRQVILIVIFGLLSLIMLPTVGKSQDLSGIKVLLLNGESDEENSLTLSGSTGLKITNNSYIYQTKENDNVGVEYDRYRLLLIETTDKSTVDDLLHKIDQLNRVKIKTTNEIITKNKQIFYRVIAGGFSSIEQLNDFKTVIEDHLNITGKVIGPLHLTLGDISNDQLLKIKLQQLTDLGFHAYVIQVYNKSLNQWKKQIWVGEESNINGLQQLEQSILKKLHVNLHQAIVDQYVMEKQGFQIDKSGILTYPLLSFPQTMVIHINPIDIKGKTSTILLKERTSGVHANQYRGAITIQIDNDIFSVVNELSIQQYLYGVVGSEMYDAWPIEALKAQAIAARTYAYNKLLNPRSKIADIFDTTADQVYNGILKESDKIKAAVDGTKGIIAIMNGKPINAFYSSNAGGKTADGTEVWGQTIPYTEVKDSPWDKSVLDTTWLWYRIIRDNGETGYVRSDLIDKLDKYNNLGYQYGVINDEPVNFRIGPSIYDFYATTTLLKNEEIVILDTVYENNPYSWIAGPISVADMTKMVNTYLLDSSKPFTQPIMDLKVMERGSSGRVTKLADGETPIPVKYPDYYRTMLGGKANGVRSTLFNIEQTGRIEVLGADGKKASIVNGRDSVFVQSKDLLSILKGANYNNKEYMIMDSNQTLRIATKDQSYIIHGNGFGHGIGMSQWGAKGLADNGYTYQEILKYYYKNIELKKIY